MQLMLSCYQFNTDCHNFRKLYVIPRVTTKEIAVEYT